MKNNINLSVLVPAYNEGLNLKTTINKIYEFLNNCESINEYEIIVINDGSTDNTEEIILDLKTDIKKIKLINLKENKSKAFALDVGIKYSKFEIIGTIDADGQYNPNDFKKMLGFLENDFDFINGYRHLRQDPNNTIIFSKIYNMILRILFNTDIKDFFSGIKLYKKKYLEIINFNSVPRFFIFFFLKYNFKIKEIEIHHEKRLNGKSTYSYMGRFVLALQDLFVILFLISIGKDKIYLFKQFSYFLLLFISLLLFVLIGLLNFQLNNFIYAIFIFTISLISSFNIIDSFFKRKSEEVDYSKFIKSVK